MSRPFGSTAENTQQKRAEIARLYMNGEGCTSIGTKYGITRQAVYFHVRQVASIRKPNEAWSAEEDDALRTNYHLGTKLCAELLHRTKDAIWNRSRRLGLSEKRVR